MKRIVSSILISLLIAVKLMAQTPIAPSVGDGTSAHPFEIATWQNLYWLAKNTSYWASGYYFIQTADIDLSTATPSISTWNDMPYTYGWPMIGSERNGIYFQGNYNGQNHTVKGLYVGGTFGYCGLFGIIYHASIKNLGVVDVNISITGGLADQKSIGGLVGRANASTIENCYSTGNISSQYLNTGGLIGRIDNGSSVRYCYSSCNVSISGYNVQGAGGLVGDNSGSSIINCYSTGNVTGGAETDCVGGFIGFNDSSPTVINCYSKGAVSCPGYYTGGLIAYHEGAPVSNCFWDIETSGKTSSASGTGKTTAQMKTYSTYSGASWDLIGELTNGTADIWGFDGTGATNNGYPFLAWQGLTSKVYPIVTTQAVSGTTSTSATGNGILNVIGYPSTTQYGICWSSSSANPTTSDNKTENGIATSEGLYNGSMTGLSPNTQYYYCTYATSSLGTVYGDVINFTTLPVLPTVTTQAVSSITNISATGNGNITNIGIPNPTQHGVCWNTTGNPTVSDSKTEDGSVSTTGSFTSNITHLIPNTTYYLKAYATNLGGTVYGSEVTFTTDIGLAVTTQAVSNIGQATATGNGNIIGLGVSNPTQHGVCWSTSPNPTIANSHTQDGSTSSTGAYTSSITGLLPYTTYYVKAYATDSKGTVYGDEVSFTTLPTAPVITTQAVSNILETTATGNGNIIELGAPNPTQHGVCWNTTGNPTISDSKTEDGSISATGAFTSNITGLLSNTTYYVKAYATNITGTVYGQEVNFTTYQMPGVSTLAVSNITGTSATGNGNIILISNPSITQHGICWNTSGNPTINDNKTLEGNMLTTGTYSSSLTNLLSNTTYYVKAYATNSLGTVYGSEVSFTTNRFNGSGTSADPYQVSTLDELKAIADNTSYLSKYFIQTANIDASATSTWNSGAGWSPIGNNTNRFTGNYNGQNHTISGLYINRASAYQGLFGSTSGATIKNLGVIATNVSISGDNQYVGALAGNLTTTTIENCYSTGTVSSQYHSCGGLVGANQSSSVIKCSYSSCSVSVIGSRYSTGGLVGYNVGSSIYNSYATGSVSGAYAVGGLAGNCSGTSTISNSYSKGTVSGSSTGGLVGVNYGTLTCTNSFWDTQTSGQSSSGGGTGKTTAQLNAYSTFIGATWDFIGETANGAVDIWGIDETGTANSGYPFLLWQGYEHKLYPTITTQAVTDITTNTATGNGNITFLGSPDPTHYGICWGTSSNPTISDSKTDGGATSTAGAFTGLITGLAPYTTYYVRSYATNSAGTVYGSAVSFTTLPAAPAVTTQAVTGISATTATGNGNITSLGAPNPTQHGVCWNTTGNPSTSDSKTEMGSTSTTGAFTSAMTSLMPNTKYYVKAYATNIVGTVYGDQVEFTTDKSLAIATQSVSNITANSATGNANIIELGETNPTQHGICWNTTSNPTTSNYKTELGATSATGAFTSSITGLSPYTVYYVKAYATDSKGTVYGNEVNFTTLPIAPVISTQNATNISTTTATGNGNISNLGNPSASQYGVCWNTTGNPSISDNKTQQGIPSGTGSFTSSITGLTPNTSYYVKAYATYVTGTVYGQEVSFTTYQIPVVTTQAASFINATFANVSGAITVIGNPTPTQFGFCWNTTGTPTIDDSKIENGSVSTIVDYTSILTGLTPNTTYYVRAYATNSLGTAYGNEVSFKTTIFDGSGTSDDPYLIQNLSDLTVLANNSSYWNKYFIQTADIDASQTSTWNSGAGWIPIGNTTTLFSGSYDGESHKITGLSINRAYAYQGLFGYTNGATIKNLGVINVTISVSGDYNQHIGALIGYASDNSYIENCYSTGSISGQYQNVGGLIGASNNSTVSNSYSTCSVTVTGNYHYSTGGLVGYNLDGTVTNSYTTGNVIGSHMVGGLIGNNNNSCTVINCFSKGSVTGTADVGGLIGYNGGSLNCANSFWDTQTSGVTSSAGGTGLTTAQMKKYLTYFEATWDFIGETENGSNNIWGIDESGITNGGYPFLFWEGYTQKVYPSVITLNASNITQTGATGNGKYNLLGYPEATVFGICWSTNSNPTINDNVKSDIVPSADSSFTTLLNNLSPYTIYYVRAFATNSVGTVYGNQVVFKTLASVPEVTSQAITNITTTAATGNGTIVNLGSANVIQYGVCWSTAENPTLNDSKTEQGATSFTGAFTSEMTGLTAATKYYVRAYATNELGTSYGEQVEFTTTQQTQIITFDPLNSVTYGDNTFELNATSTSGLDVNYTSSNESVAIVSGKVVTIVGAGETTITAKQAGNNQYFAANNVEQELTVNKKTLTVTAQSTDRCFNAENPVFELTYSGFINSENEDILDTKPIASCSAIQNSPAGVYDIEVSGGNDKNYGFTYVKGQLTVNPLPTTPTISISRNVLHSDASEGNQWYNQIGLINNAINQDYTATSSGSYYVIVTLLGCSSDASNTINYSEPINITTLSISDITDVSVNASFTCDNDGEVYYAVLNANATVPTANEIQQGVTGAIATGNKTVVKNVATIASISGLTASTAYTIYAVVVDAQSNHSDISSKNFTTLATGIDITDQEGVRIYPNPVTTTLLICMDKADGKGVYTLYSIAGSKLSEGRIENGKVSVNLEGYKSGVYILKISDGKSMKDYKVVKE